MNYFITHTTENYEEITLQLAKSINKYSKHELIVYTIDYEGSDKLKSFAICKRIDLNLPELNKNDFIEQHGNSYVSRESVRTFLALGGKIDAMIEACDSQIDNWVYIDSDCIANTNIDDIFSYCNEVESFPLASLGPYEFILLTNPDGSVKGNPFWKNDNSVDLKNTLEWPMMDFFNMKPEQRGQYHTTNILVGTKHVKPFLEVWRDCKNLFPKITNVYNVSPLQEETIYNVLTWRIKDKGLPMVYVNVKGADTVKHFLETNTDQDIFVSEYYKLPKDKNKIIAFHGEKRIEEIEKMFDLIDNQKTKILFVAPHLSTGGMPSFLLKRIKSLLEYSKDIEIFVVEFTNVSYDYVVQRNEILEIIGEDHFWSLGENKLELIDIIKNNNINIVHIDEMIECLDSYTKAPESLFDKIYDKNRTWRVVETCHNVWFNPDTSKKYSPDGYAFCTPWHQVATFKHMPSKNMVAEFPIENNIPTIEEKTEAKKQLGFDLDKKHVINVGLWTQGKNQKEGVEIAKHLLQTNPEIQFHFIGNQAPNFKEYWEPIMQDIPSNVTVWGERNDVDTFMKAADVFMFNSTWECNPLAIREATSYGLPTLSRNLKQYLDMFTYYITEIKDDIIENADILLKTISNPKSYSLPLNQVEEFAQKHIDFYKLLLNSKPQEQVYNPEKLNYILTFINQPYFELLGNSDSDYKVQFVDENDKIHYEDTIKCNMWTKLNRQYFTKWTIKVWKDEELVLEQTLNLKNKRVFISIDSKSLGDTLAWFPYIDEFRKKHECQVVVSTFWNNLFKTEYPELEFITPGSTAHNINSAYTIGCYYNSDKEPELFNTIPLQKVSSNILGLPHTEIKPKISFIPTENKRDKKYITIGYHSTSGLKYWNNPTGWQELVNYFIENGYEVLNLSLESSELKGVIELEDKSMDNIMNLLHYSEFFVGLSSGLSWLAWALNKQVVLISNMTNKEHEFQSNCIRIVNESVCNSCWVDPNFQFDKGDWYWCPRHKNTDRHFECTKSISAEMVINKLRYLVENKKS